MFPIFVTLYTPAIFFGKVDTWWMQLFAWLPPLSIGNAPLQYASGYMNLAQFSLSMLLMAVITAITVDYVAKISWGKALSGATRAS
ncbi:hypothetical protein [uncultured Corynebacterium sp.]|uniref:hypothetical protein n=1 Tax=uncultured Corynebacterium sp. TaxID=159447 RepID=UPI00260D7381|nr:hypothetical protein [uncultured Corynebacterium sp.]